ncbi:MAG: hypothetical protein DRQ49_00520 [Gammaproteobacteria bacterium]|nr:MAG: hypothetical protein DRQ41_12335 [Gammaproteobacteria bacterium]RKZ42847.1 MAG: hypothetical protein DRQ49_00520 [Gammaproteobacteria bacterium]RKZ71878.1 MAG: hypothetical protein DRQ57_18090 [Gammaproteobacteria bacterium]
MAKKAFFMKRLNDHIQYLKKMDVALKGEEDFSGSTHKNCKLGQWLYDEGLTEVGAMENSKAKEVFESLLGPHEQFHILGNEALDKKLAGDEAGAQAIFTQLHVLSNTLTNKLLDLDGMN